MLEADIVSKLKAIYSDTAKYYETLPVEAKRGFGILNGPPIFRPFVMFIGYQGAGDGKPTSPPSDQLWPSTCKYATGDYRFARNLRSMFDKFDPNFLSKCVGTNIIFVHSPKQSTYEMAVKPEVRTNIESFCGERLREIIQLVQPRRIVVIGFETMKHIVASKIIADGAGEPEYGPKGSKALWEIRDFDGRKVLAMFHLTGGRRYTSEDRKMVADRIWQDVEADRRKAV